MAKKQKAKPAKTAKPQAKKSAKPALKRKAAPAKAAKPSKPAAKPKKAQPKPQPKPPAAKAAAAKPVASAPRRETAASAPQPATPASATQSSPLLSNALLRSTTTPSGASPTDGGVRYLSVQDVVDLHKAVASEFGGTQAHPGVVESQFGLLNAVQRPQITTLGREAYPQFADKVAAFVFALLQAHPFRGGNRRVALASIFAFSELNNRTVDSRVLDEKTAETVLKRG